MLPERDKAYLIDIRNAILKINVYCADTSLENFLKNEVLQNAVIRMLTIIGEAANKVSKDTRQNIPKVEWEDIIGMRNRLVHEYFRVNLSLVWETIRQDLPALLTEVEEVLSRN